MQRCKSEDILAAEGDGARASYHLICSGLISLQESALSQLRAPIQHERNIISRHGRQQVQVTSLLLSPQCESSCSLQFCFWLKTSVWSLSPSGALCLICDWNCDSGSSLVATSSPHSPYWTGLGAVLGGSTSSSPRPVKVRSVLQKEAVCRVGQVMAVQCRWMEDMSTGKAGWRKEKAATKGHHRRRRRSQKYKEEKMERREGGGYWTVSGREPGLTSQT